MRVVIVVIGQSGLIKTSKFNQSNSVLNFY